MLVPVAKRSAIMHHSCLRRAQNCLRSLASTLSASAPPGAEVAPVASLVAGLAHIAHRPPLPLRLALCYRQCAALAGPSRQLKQTPLAVGIPVFSRPPLVPAVASACRPFARC